MNLHFLYHFYRWRCTINKFEELPICTRKQIFYLLNDWYEVDEKLTITDEHFLKWSVEQILPQLLPSYQTIFHLWIQGYSTNEMANKLQTSEGNILGIASTIPIMPPLAQ